MVEKKCSSIELKGIGKSMNRKVEKEREVGGQREGDRKGGRETKNISCFWSQFTLPDNKLKFNQI